MRILVFATGFAPYNASENIVNSKLVLAFRSRGWDVTVISRADDSPMYGAGWSEPWAPLHALTDEVRYATDSRGHRLVDAGVALIKMRCYSDSVRWAKRALTRALAKHHQCPFDLVISRSPTDGAHLPALRFHERTGVPWFANWNDPPVHAWPAPYCVDIRPWRRWLGRQFAATILARATCNTFPCERLRDHILRHTLSTDVTTSVIPHIGLINAELASNAADQMLTFCHAGNLSRERQAGNVIEAFSRFVRSGNIGDAELHIIGVRADSSAFHAGDTNSVKAIRTFEPVPYADVMATLAQRHVLVVQEALLTEGIFLPSKLVDYAQTGRPILAVGPSNGTVNDLLTRHGGGISVDQRSVDDIEAAFATLYQAWKDGTLYTRYDSSALYSLFSPDSVIAQYETLIADHVGESRCRH